MNPVLRSWAGTPLTGAATTTLPPLAATTSSLMLQTLFDPLPVGPAPVRTSFKYHGSPPTRRRDLILALLFAAGMHAALLFGDLLFPAKAAPRVASAPDIPVIALELPPIEDPETAEIQENFGDDTLEPALAPPMQTDVPTVTVSLFTQPIQIAPQNIEVGKGITRIPTGRPGNPLGTGLCAVFDINAIDQAPTVRSHVPPNYPLELRRKGTTGSVLVQFIVDRDGTVIAATATESTHMAFEAPAVAAVKRWKFRPGKKAGRAVNTRVRQSINFTMEAE
jgi:periplasmic protein TonB